MRLINKLVSQLLMSSPLPQYDFKMSTETTVPLPLSCTSFVWNFDRSHPVVFNNTVIYRVNNTTYISNQY